MPKPNGAILKARDFEVRPVALNVCQKLTEQFHYSRGGSNTGTFCHGLFLKGVYDFCFGIAWWLPPTKAAAIASWNGRWEEVLALSHLSVDPLMPTNSESFLIGSSIRLIRKDGRFRCLVSYADAWQNHAGTIYKATNWEDMGLTKSTSVWVNSAGRMVARKAGPKSRTKSEMEALGYKMIGRFPKRKFRILL